MKYVIYYTLESGSGKAQFYVPDKNLEDKEYEKRLAILLSSVTEMEDNLRKSGAKVTRRLER